MRVLITGANGQLGHDLLDAFSGIVPTAGIRCSLLGDIGVPGDRLSGSIGHDVLGTDVDTMPVEDRTAVMSVFDEFQPDIVVHAGALTAVDLCESEIDLAFQVNAIGTRNIAEAASMCGAHVLYVSTDYVFDGTSKVPYREWDAPNPKSVYGRSKLAGELECRPGSTIVRTSWVCGAHGSNMVKTALSLASKAGSTSKVDTPSESSESSESSENSDLDCMVDLAPLYFVDDQYGSPTFTPDLAPAIVTLACDKRPGIFHVTNQGSTTWFGFVRAVLAEAGYDPNRVQPIATLELDPPRPAQRPANSVLDNMALRLSGLPLLPDWNDSLRRLLAILHPSPNGR